MSSRNPTVWNPGLDNKDVSLNNERNNQNNISNNPSSSILPSSFKSSSSSNFSSLPSSSSSLPVSSQFAFIAAAEQYFRLQQNNQINKLKQQQTCLLPQLPPFLFGGDGRIPFRRPPFFQSSLLPPPMPFIPPNSSSTSNNKTTIPHPFILPFPPFPFQSFGGGHLGQNFANLAMTLTAKNQQQKQESTIVIEEKNNKEKIKRRKLLINSKTRKRPFPSKLNFINNNESNEEIKTINDNCEAKKEENEEKIAKIAKINSLPTTNPIIELVFRKENNINNNNNPLTINFNTCAICGASFRLTSELIQHARSNHRQPSRYDSLEGPSIEEVQKLNIKRNGNIARKKE
ncbi:hypothetical protein ACQ4LE_008546 [Meloidogyne hapla]|uniref:C2H2-type domain-containing protein n=1 Tax=Meloidogyne hapla TaxID=6305 RepID=A0A1I8B4Q2_MELHA